MTAQYQPIALLDWQKYLQSLVGRVETLEADQTSHPVIDAKSMAKWIGDYIADLESCLKKANRVIAAEGIQRLELNKADKLNNVVSKISAVSDFIKRIGDDSFLLDTSTPLGLHLIMDECIDTLKEIGGLHE